jgi:hypothetical protein
LNVTATCGDPWKKITVDESIKPILTEKGGAFSISIGLALKND